MLTRQKRRILPDTMIQEIGRSVKCQKLNKFINRTPKLSVNKPNPLRGDQFSGDPRWLSGYAGTFFPLTAPPAGHKFVLNPCRKAHRNYSLFPIHYSLFTCPARRHTAPRQTRPLPGNARELLPAGALSPPGHGPCPGCVRVSLACPQILSANCSPQGLPYFMGI